VSTAVPVEARSDPVPHWEDTSSWSRTWRSIRRVARVVKRPLVVLVLAVFVTWNVWAAADDYGRYVETTMKTLATAALYAMMALGFVLIYKATQTINFAQGAFALVGSWLLSMLFIDLDIPGRWFASPLWLSWGLAVILAVTASVLLGLIVERLAIRPMIGEPIFSVAVITLGLEIVLRVVAVDAINVSTRSLGIPWSGQLRLGDARIPLTFLVAIGVALVCFVLCLLFFRTRTGIAMRATAFDQEVAQAQGIGVGKMFAIAWGAGAALACLSGIFASPLPLQTGTANITASTFAFRTLPVIILGGLDSVGGAVAGALVIGYFEIFAGEYLAFATNTLGAGYSQIIPYIVMLVGLLVRPYGIFGTKEIRRV
jgi:branched-chain amino acid transport system permease protein